jgi:hypothetical protein
MVTKEIFVFVVGFVALLSFSLGVVWQSESHETLAEELETYEPIIAQSGEFTMTAKYVTNNNWEYEITGSFDNQCPKFDISTELIDSVPSVAKVKIVVYKPTDEVLCAQSIKPVKETGTFSASADTEIEFIMQETEARSTVTGLPALEE